MFLLQMAVLLLVIGPLFFNVTFWRWLVLLTTERGTVASLLLCSAAVPALIYLGWRSPFLSRTDVAFRRHFTLEILIAFLRCTCVASLGRVRAWVCMSAR